MDTSSDLSGTETTSRLAADSATAADSLRRLKAMHLSDMSDDETSNHEDKGNLKDNAINTPESTGLNKTVLNKTANLSDSDDDDDLDAPFNGFDNLNLPARLKRLMRDTTLTKDGIDDDSDDSNDEKGDPIQDNALFRTPSALKSAAIQEMLKTAPPPAPAPATTESSSKVRRKKTIDFLDQHSDYSSSDDDQPAHSTPSRRRRQPQKKQQQKPKPKASARKKRAPKKSDEGKRGEKEGNRSANGSNDEDDDRDSSSSSSSNDEATSRSERPPKRKMSKKAEMLMHQENQRFARSVSARLQPRTNKLVIGGAVEKIKGRKLTESAVKDGCGLAKLTEANEPAQQQQPDRRQRAMMAFLEDDDSDIEIVGGPSKRGYELASPDRLRQPMQFWQQSPVRKTMTHRDLNKKLEERMMEEMASMRKEYEEKARARGSYLTPEERAKKQIELEKEAKVIDLQVKQHFLKGKAEDRNPTATNSRSDDIDEEEAPLMYSGDEEEPDDEEVLLGSDDDGDALKKDLLDDDDNDKGNDTAIVGPEEDEVMQDQDNTNAGFAENEGATNTGKRKRNNAILMDDEEEKSDDDDERSKKLKEGLSLSDFLKDHPATNKDTPTTTNPSSSEKKSKSKYLDAEAEESEDEYYGAGGADLSDDEHLDRFEQDGMLVDKTDEHVDEEALRATLNNQLAETDKHMVERLLKDIMSGDLRRRRAAKEMGLMLEDFDIYDDNDNDLVALRLAAAERRRKLLEESGDGLELLAKDPKTRAFAQAGQPLPETNDACGLSDIEEDNDQENEPGSKVSMIMESDEEIEIPIDDDNEDEPIDILEESATIHTNMITSTMVDEYEERIDIIERVRDDPASSPTARAQRRNRLRHLLNDVNSSLGSTSETGPRMGLTAAQQTKERKVKNDSLKEIAPQHSCCYVTYGMC
ncbi:MRC1-like domain-containing protein [Zychaea mexicana]|uniref:MRC1-like domain-containing protein n=1 Tax=Zychaea mexicana TaxID=64656 RepID=UPI0022FF45EA|nr:MRC1-like domain-containing protein [Zychaea mexicana]KAI9498638.1 MRC1-like domain-containing protein [Zychaea mexicana]